MEQAVEQNPASEVEIEDSASDGEDEGRRNWVRWSAEEHNKLSELVRKHGVNRSWAMIAAHIPGRTGKQCRERWLNHTNEGTKKGNWSHTEEFILAIQHALLGSQWCRISRYLPGRTDNSVKNHWNATWRSKVMHKPQSILWLYTTELKAGHPPPNAVRVALAKWEHNVPGHQVTDSLGFWPSQNMEVPIAKLFKITHQKVIDEFGNPNETTPQQDYMKVMGITNMHTHSVPTFPPNAADPFAPAAASNNNTGHLMNLPGGGLAMASTRDMQLGMPQVHVAVPAAQRPVAALGNVQSHVQTNISSIFNPQQGSMVYAPVAAPAARSSAAADAAGIARQESSPQSPESRSDNSSAHMQHLQQAAQAANESMANGAAVALPDAPVAATVEAVFQGSMAAGSQNAMSMLPGTMQPQANMGSYPSAGQVMPMGQVLTATVNAAGQLVMTPTPAPAMQTVVVQQGPNGVLQLVPISTAATGAGDMGWMQTAAAPMTLGSGQTVMVQPNGQTMVMQSGGLRPVAAGYAGGQQVISMPMMGGMMPGMATTVPAAPSTMSMLPSSGGSGPVPGVANPLVMQVQPAPGAAASGTPSVSEGATGNGGVVLQTASGAQPWGGQQVAVADASAPMRQSGEGSSPVATVAGVAAGSTISSGATVTGAASGVTLTLGPGEQQALLRALLMQHGINAVLT